MRKGSHKLKGLGNVADVIAAAPSITAAARTLNVDRSSVHRWVQAGKVPKPGGGQPAAVTSAIPAPNQTPEAWRRAVRKSYALSPTEAALLDLAVSALTMARDETAKPEVRLAAMGRYQTLVKQLDLEVPSSGKTETGNVRQFPRGA